jgi:hypothetical protein
VLTEGDEQVDLTIKEEKETQDTDLLLPPQIQTKSCQMRVVFLKAEGLPKLDDAMIGKGTCDPFVEVDFAGNILKT